MTDREPPAPSGATPPSGASAPPGASPPIGAPPPDWPGDPWAWGGPWARRRARRRRARQRRRDAWGGGPGPHGGFLRFLGCLVVALVLLVGAATAVATWVAGIVLGFVAPGVGPSSLTAVAVILVAVVAMAAAFRVIGGAVGPLAEIGEATERVADGEAQVRVRPRGPGAVRNLAVSFNAMAERLDRSRDDRRTMLAGVTHELRTPLTVIAGELEAMIDGVHPLDTAHVAPVLAETKVMERLLEDLRTLSLSDAGALALHREPTDLRALAADVVAAHGPAADNAGVGLALADGPALVTSIDPVRVREILVNLVTNAIRHTPAGGRIDVTVRRENDAALLQVADTGEGIAPDDLPLVFDRFHRRADSGGSGLGLSIVRDLAAAHGGRVTASSDGVPGRGATFRVWLPIRD